MNNIHQGTEKVKELRAQSYIESSAYTGEGVSVIVNAVVEAHWHASQMRLASRASQNTSFILSLRESIARMVCGSLQME